MRRRTTGKGRGSRAAYQNFGYFISRHSQPLLSWILSWIKCWSFALHASVLAKALLECGATTMPLPKKLMESHAAYFFIIWRFIDLCSNYILDCTANICKSFSCHYTNSHPDINFALFIFRITFHCSIVILILALSFNYYIIPHIIFHHS